MGVVARNAPTRAAIALYEQALTIDPEYSGAQHNLAEAHRLLNLQTNPEDDTDS
jgi:hypothetical protein